MEAHKQQFNKVLEEIAKWYFVRSTEWKHHRNKYNTNNKILTRITEQTIITIANNDNKFITLNNYVYLYTPKQLNISYYK